jgi:DNA-directed RNA polymerase specialized sigma24 family protein
MVKLIAFGSQTCQEQQPAADLQLPVPAADLVAFEQTPEAEHLRRLEADQELMLRLAAEGFGGDAWRTLSNALAKYGYAVVRAWIKTGLIVSKCRSRGLRIDDVLSEDPPARHEVADLTQEVVAEALVSFRDRVLARAVWNAGGGASLATFFIRMCLIKFPNTRRAWLRGRDRWGTPVSFDPSIHLHPTVPSPEAQIIDDVTSNDATAALLEPVKDEVNRAIIRLRAEDYGIGEISEITGLSYKQVESRLYRARALLRSRLKVVKAEARG